MPIIYFAQNKKNPITVVSGANLMNSLRQNDVPVASSCHGEGVCSKCRIQIIKGNENLSPKTEFEQKLSERNNLKPDERISCQTQVLDDITIATGYW